MNAVLLLLFACGFVGLFTRVSTAKGYILSLIGSGIVAGLLLVFPSLMS